MGDGLNLNLDALLDALAEKVAAKLSAQNGNGALVAPRLLSIDQAAVYLGRSKEAVAHMVASGKIPKVQGDRRIQLDVRDLDQWIEENKQQPIK